MPTLAQITKELLSSYNRMPRKNLGQHFLIDPKVLERLISAAEINSDDVVIEIGSGLGVVTSEIAKRCQAVIAVEIDKELLRISRDVLSSLNNITFVGQDILKTSLDDLAGEKSYKVIGNLPYYITAPIVEKILTAKNKPELAIIMVQKEVAERMIAKPGTKTYGSFSIFSQLYASISLISLVSKSSFLPWPEVSSAIVAIRPYTTPHYPVKDEKLFFNIVHAAFQQRRKKLRNSLAKFNLQSKNIDLNRRPETLSIEEFCALVL
jgi:16S rRNA (adenine1518-N6/adenine1519-N6)-dimethyltransferase